MVQKYLTCMIIQVLNNMTNHKEFLTNYLDEQSSCLRELSKNTSLLESIIEKLLDARSSDSLVITIGNGGSASTASHFTADLLKTAIMKDQKHQPLILKCLEVKRLLQKLKRVNYLMIVLVVILNLIAD